jgi:ABC-type uncharacterized transport system fused permease/ATPase subunit
MSGLTARLGIRISPDTDRRLRLLQLKLRKPLSVVLDEVLDAALPSAEVLADQLKAAPDQERVA